jgi:anti-sigma regulatory factor (Ser/Thr protein kinase)
VAQSLRIENDLNALGEMSNWVAVSCKSLGFPDTLSFRLDLVTNEAVANTISYGYPPGVRGEIALRLGMADGNAVLEIEDDGIEFNPLQLAEPSHSRSIEEIRVGGLRRAAPTQEHGAMRISAPRRA